MSHPLSETNQGGGTRLHQVEQIRQLWRQVCASRGTPAPDPARLDGFMGGLGATEREKLESILTLAARGREKPGELGLISWAASCTRPAVFGQLAAHGLGFTSAELFACGLSLREKGWDMQMRLAQLASNPEDVATLRACLPAHGYVELGTPPGQALSAPERPHETAVDEACISWPDNGHDDNASAGHATGRESEPMKGLPADSVSSSLSDLPELPTRHERQRAEAYSNASTSSGASVKASARRASEEGRLRLRLYGKSAAHTLEVTSHRRGGDFMGVHVVSIDSAHALDSGAGYDWERKLVLQLTPEEMPGLIATLMGITPSVRFGHHGADRSKFVEVRRQESGLVIVTGEKALSYSVPVPTGTVYYVLELFCRAMAMGVEVDKPERSISDVLTLVKSAHGF